MKDASSKKQYDHNKIESKWQKQWAKKKIYKTGESAKEKFYILDMFPYPSGEGLHVGHPKGYIATDVVSRLMRMQGKNVLHPMGFDAFGLPAENYAIKMKTNPAVAVAKNVARYKEQLEKFGFDYDWSHEINTTDPAYYKWTQWIFLKLLEKGLAFQSHEPIDWCPSCKTGLAKEDIEDGKCERCSTPVEKKLLKQWVLKITDYAERLLTDLDAVDLPLMIQTTGPDAIRKDLPLQHRQAVICIVKHWSEDKYLCLQWKKVDWKGFVVGGIENGEGVEITAVREIQEETGYKNARFVKTLGRVDSQFYQAVKQVNRFAHFTAVYLELTDGEHTEVAQEEIDLHDAVWKSRDEVALYINRPDLKYVWDLYLGKEKQNPTLDWPASIKELQRNWIGKSEGMIFTAPVKDTKLTIQTFSAHFEACYADTFVAIAPDHNRLPELLTGLPEAKKAEVLAFAKKIVEKRASQGFVEEKESEGIFTGRYIVDPLGNGDLPIWVASFALADYGTGIVKCSCHDERDFAFAKKYQIPLKAVLFPEDKELAKRVSNFEICFSDAQKGVLSEPKEFAGQNARSVRQGVIKHLEQKGLATRKTTYRLRDWVFSRQRYWGEPIPVIHCEKCGTVPVPEKDLPVKLPKVKFYEPTGTGESPLAAIEKWVKVKCPKCRGKARRETNTMPQWAGSSWYYLRYMDAKNKKALVSSDLEKYWSPVDLYVGGAEHATRHLIYARFWHKFLYDLGVVSSNEPFKKLQHVGLIMAEDGRKMSKRWGNVVNPDDIIATYGVDTLRLYEMFMGPFDQQIAWSTASMIGSRRFIERVWKMGEKVLKEKKIKNPTLDALLHKTIKKVGEDIVIMKFNTAVSSLMILLNLAETETFTKEQYAIFLKLLAPFAPHVTEELWAMLGHKTSIHLTPWPVCDEGKISAESKPLIVQINGKVRATLITTSDLSDSEIEAQARTLPEVQRWLNGATVKKVIVVSGRLINFVIST